MHPVLKVCAVVALVSSACVASDDVLEGGHAGVVQAVDQATDIEAKYPPTPWVAPTLLVDSNFPGGVLKFSSSQRFIEFYQALDAASGSDGAANGSLGTTPYAAATTSSATVNYQAFTIKLSAGQVLDLGTCDVEGSSFSGDTYLRLFLNATELASSDDACGGVGSEISYTAAIDGTYEVRMGCFSSGTCSGTVGYSVSTPGASGGLAGARSFAGAGTSSATTGVSTAIVPLSQGQVIDVGTCGISGGSFGGDTYLRLIDTELGGNVEVATSDDACGGTGSRITYTAARTGLYQVRLGCYASTTCSGVAAYTITPEPSIGQMLPLNFTSASTYLASRPAEPAGDTISDVDANEFTLDLKEALTEDDTLRHLVDPDLQVVIEDRLYQLTNIGVFQVDLWAIAPYRAWLNANSYAINTDPGFQSIPGEVPLGDGAYQVMPGVIRTVGGWGTPSVKLLGFDEDASECTSCAAKPVRGAGFEAAAGGTSSPAGGRGTRGADSELGRISYWFGKVNTHKAPGGSWTWDTDCTSGANIDPLQYCRKYWPNTTSVTPVPVSSKPGNLWFTAGCGMAFPSDGQQEWICNGELPSCNQPPPAIGYTNYSLGSNFSRKESIGFGNKRFVFKARSPGFRISIGSFEIGFHTIYIKAKLQRKKRFLGIGYWAPSYADEIVLGVENMKLDTDYIVPYPQMYNTLSRPKFDKLAKYKLGSKLIDVANITFNANIPFYPITQQNLADWTNSAFNSLIGSTYNNIWKFIENNIMDSIDPGFRTRHAAYTKMVDAINDEHKLRWAIGGAEKPMCNVHKNNWTFDTNGGIKFTQNGGVAGPPGSPPAQVSYKYTMKAGSFYGRARVGSSWYGIRMVRQ
jgi:hypothetical protein